MCIAELGMTLSTRSRQHEIDIGGGICKQSLSVLADKLRLLLR